MRVPDYIEEVVEQVAFQAREDKRIDSRSGVSPAAAHLRSWKTWFRNAERRALRGREDAAVPRVLDVYSALPAITGKFELEYEGELKGGDTMARELIRARRRQEFTTIFRGRESVSRSCSGSSWAAR